MDPSISNDLNLNGSNSVTPVLNIVQTFLNEKDLYEAVVGLPKSMEFIPLITKLATHSKFKYIECKFISCYQFKKYSNIFFYAIANADSLVKQLPDIRKSVGNLFDVHMLFSNDRVFSALGKILCGKPFPRNDNIQFVDNVLYSPDYNGPDKDELDVMPSKPFHK